MATTFDGSTGGHALLSEHDQNGFTEPGVSSLDMLRDALAQQQDIEDVTIEVPGVPIRLVCHPDIPSKQMSSWQRRALPPNKRNAASVSPLDMDQGQFLSTVLLRTTVRVEVENQGAPGTWRVIEDGSGNVLTFADGALLATFGAMDAATALKRLFPRDSDMARAARQVLAASGWDEDAQGRLMADDDDEDPTD
jgi:hypothetical protein